MISPIRYDNDDDDDECGGGGGGGCGGDGGGGGSDQVCQRHSLPPEKLAHGSSFRWNTSILWCSLQKERSTARPCESFECT